MVSPPGDQPEPQRSEPTPAAAKPPADWMAQIDTEQAFRLVDSILPFEACLYHQVLPLTLEGSRLKLGMVNPDDSAALDYVRRILAYMNCSLVPQALASDVHYAALSAYLNYADSQKKAAPTSQPVARRIAKKLAEQSAKRIAESKFPGGAAPVAGNSRDPNSQPTFVVDSPTELPPMPLEETVPVTKAISGDHLSGTTSARNSPSAAIEDLLPEATNIAEDLAVPPIPELRIDPHYLTEPSEVLATLTTKQLLDELLGRILSWGIGRLYLERQLHHGQIVWSQNGSVQPVLEDIGLETLDGVLQELKALMQLPHIPTQKPKQVEVEWRYQNRRLLLRLRLVPGQHGEEATLQALRGAALRFYRQQQLVTLGQEALSMAQQLQNKIDAIQIYNHAHGVVLPEHLSVFPDLNRMLQRLSHQIDELHAFEGDNRAEED